MSRPLYLLLALIVLYFGLSYLNVAIYGPSYGFLNGEDCWVPDGHGGWLAHGSPGGSAPAEPSVNVPLAVRYVPILVPGLILVVFLFTPLRRTLERPLPTDESESPTDETPREEKPE